MPAHKLKSLLKTLRSSQPFNYLATTTTRLVLASLGLRSELVIKHLHRVGHVQVRLPNGRVLRLWSRGDDWVSNQVFWRGWEGYEPETIEVFFRLAAQSSVIIDVGAYVGIYALVAALANDQAQVHAFEPLPRNYERLQRHVALNRMTNVHCHQAAVGAHSGTADFYFHSADMPTSSSLSYEFMAATGRPQSLAVPLVTLDQFAQEAGLARIDLVKLDTESTEPQVLQGMDALLARDRPDIICEVLKGRGAEESLEQLLRPHGYRFYLLTPDGLVEQSHIVGHPAWLNYLFSARPPAEVARILVLCPAS